jgi:uncharacterized phage-associated protein
MTAFAPLAVANAVLDEARDQGKSLTIMQLLKLVYIAHGWSLALLNVPLVNEEPEAWQHGPVFPSIYREFRRFGSQPIQGSAMGPFGAPQVANLSDAQFGRTELRRYACFFVVPDNARNRHAMVENISRRLG